MQAGLLDLLYFLQCCDERIGNESHNAVRVGQWTGI